MGKNKRKYNAKGRQQVETIIDNSVTNRIQVENLTKIDEYSQCANDEANKLVLPSHKRATKIITKERTVTRILSKRQRKKLEKVVELKKKKENRASLFEALAACQVPADELKQFTSISQVQTKGLKKMFHEQKFGPAKMPHSKRALPGDDDHEMASQAVNKRKRMQMLVEADDSESEDDKEEAIEKPRDYNVVGVESSDSSDEEVMVDEVVSVQTDKEVDTSPETIEKLVDKPQEPIDRKPATYVHVERSPEIQVARFQLPILAEEQQIMETISENNIIIVAGETGSGKTTQIPQFLYEAGYAAEKMIGITEPRRVAAIAMSKRVAHEMNFTSATVSYLIRFEGNVTDETRLKFMTDGVLLKEIETDFLLRKYSVIILDEAHERSIYTDILIGLLSRIVLLRAKKKLPLKLIIMSATLRIQDFTENRRLFKRPPPVINVEARQYPVAVHFNKVTADDYVREAYKKTVKIHTTQPEGGILLFLTGQQEVKYLVNKFRKAFPAAKQNGRAVERPVNEHDDQDDEDELAAFSMARRRKGNKGLHKKPKVEVAPLPKIDLDSYKIPGDDTEADLLDEGDEFNPDDSDSDDDHTASMLACSQPLWVLPLYSLLPSNKQTLVFEPPPEGTRLCVVATNVAETSLTIPNVRYVIDTGRQKTRIYDKVTGVSSFVVTYTSKASANQRAGRAGRVGPGHCYRLYSSAVFNDEFVDFSVPEIQQKPVDDLMLQMKCMGIDRVVNFPFPSAPDLVQLEMAEHRLQLLGALEPDAKTGLSRVTLLGRTVSAFPVHPRFGKMLALSCQHNLLPYTICMVAALSVQEVLEEITMSEANDSKSKWRLKRKSWAGQGNSLLLGDPMILMRAIGGAEHAHASNRLVAFCAENGLRPKAVAEIRKLRLQLTAEVNANMRNVPDYCVDPQMPPPTDLEAKLLRQILLTGMGDQVARRVQDDELKEPGDKLKFKYAYRCADMEEPVFMHSGSVLRKHQPDWVCYQEAYETRHGDGRRMFIRGITAIEPQWLLKFVPKLCNIGTPLEVPAPRYDPLTDCVYCHVNATFGKAGWEIPLSEVEMPKTQDFYRQFGKFLLDGEVFPALGKFKGLLLSTPASMTKSWSNIVARTETLLKKLMANEVGSKQRLLELWEVDKNFLLQEYLLWLPEASHSSVSVMWPPIEK